MPDTETSPKTVNPTPSPSANGGDEGIVQLLRELGEDTRTLVQQEIELARLEVARSGKRIAVDTAWIGAGAVAITVGLVCLALALALGIGALLNSSWLGALITAALFLIVGGLFTWRALRDISKGGFIPLAPLDSLKENRDWAREQMEDLKRGITEET